MTSPNKTAVMAALARVGAQGATSERLSQMTGVPIEKVRKIAGNGVYSGWFCAAMPAGTTPQTYVLAQHLQAFQEALDAPKANLPPPTQSLVKMTKTGAKSKPASKPASPPASQWQRWRHRQKKSRAIAAAPRQP